MAELESPHVVIVPSPGIGHLIPLIELAKRLVNQHGFSISFVIPTDGAPSTPQKALLSSLPPQIDSMFLPPVDLQDVAQSRNVRTETLITLTVKRSLPSLKQVLTSIASSKRVVALLVDLFGTDAFDVARELDVFAYVFFPSTAMNLSFSFYLPKLDEMVSCEFWELEEPMEVPGCIPIHGKDLEDAVQDRKNDAYKWLLHTAKRYILADGIMVNSFIELETGAINHLQETGSGKPPVYPIGPLVKMGDESDHEVLKWLDEQPCGSVVYVSFGSGGTLSYDQIIELALGLEMSEQRFLWVTRKPNDKIANATYFRNQSPNDDPFDFLPKGFLDRTKGRAMVVSSWAPQAQVLTHGSTGGFLTHCGWNSTLESIVNGVPLIAWPLYAEQKMNAVMLTEDVKIALRPKVRSENGLIKREEIANVVRCLMVGQEGLAIRNRISDLKVSASRVLSEDGSSTNALSQVATMWKSKIVTN